MTSLHNAGQGAGSKRHYMPTNGNASGATEAFKLNQSNATIALKEDLRNGLKLALLASRNVEVDAFADVVVLPMETAANDLMQEHCPNVLIDPQEALVAPVAPISRYRLLTDDDLCKLPPVQWRIKDVLPVHGTAVVFGPSGSGKSFLALDMLQSLAFGNEWFGRRVKPCSVTYIALEGEAGLSSRVNAYRIHHGSTSPNIRYMVQPFRLLNADDINELVLAIQTDGTGDVVVLDTLSRATPGSDENDSTAMGQIIAAAKLLQDLIGGLVLLIHHTGKDAARGMRGHSSLHAALDCAIEVRRTGDNRDWVLAKSKEGEDGASHSFKLEVVPMGDDSDGDAITSCVVVPNQSAQAFGKKTPKLASNQTIAHKALAEALDNAMDLDKEGAPPSGPGIGFDDAIAIVVLLMPGAARHKKLRAKEAIDGLVSKGLLVEKEGWLSHNQSIQH